MVGTVLVCVSLCVFMCVCDRDRALSRACQGGQLWGAEMGWSWAYHGKIDNQKKRLIGGLGPGHIKVVRLDKGATQ